MNPSTPIQDDRAVSLAVVATIIVIAAIATLASGCAGPTNGYGMDGRAAQNAALEAQSQGEKADTATAQQASQATYLDLIGRMQQEGQYFASLAHIDAYEAKFGVMPGSILLRADALRMTDQNEASANAYARLETTPLAAQGYHGHGLLLARTGAYIDAIPLLQKACALDPVDAAMFSDLGYAQMRRGDLGQARVPIMTAAQLAPSNAKVLGNLALYLLATGQVTQANAVMSAAQMNTDIRAAIQKQSEELLHGSGSAGLRMDFDLAHAGQADGPRTASPVAPSAIAAAPLTQ